MSLTTEQVALWRHTAKIVRNNASDTVVKILQARIIALADEVLAFREALPTPAVPEEMTGDGVLAMHDCGYIEGWNACRAAMLGGAK